MGKGQDKKKTSFDPKEKAPDAAASQPGQTVNPLTSSICFLLFFYLFIYLLLLLLLLFLKKGMYHTFFIINESIFLLFSISSSYTL